MLPIEYTLEMTKISRLCYGEYHYAKISKEEIMKAVERYKRGETSRARCLSQIFTGCFIFVYNYHVYYVR